MTFRAGLTTTTTLAETSVLVVGGNDCTQAPASAELYNPLGQSFSLTLASLATPPSGHLAFVLPDHNNVFINRGERPGFSTRGSERKRVGHAGSGGIVNAGDKRLPTRR